MKRSTDRILTTHVGSLARPPELLEILRKQMNDEAYEQATFEKLATQSVADVVKRQAEIGIDVVADGEQGKPGFQTYVGDRLSGFETRAGG